MSEPDDAHDWQIAPNKAEVSVEIGGVDVFSKLPYEVLVDVWLYCRPQELLSLCRTTKTQRAYLIDRSAEPIWKAARLGQAVTRPEGATWTNDSTGWGPDPEWIGTGSQVFRLPDPPAHLTEIAWTAFLFTTDCPYCPSDFSNAFIGTYHRACGACNEEGLRSIQHLKHDYAELNVDIRLYSILPRSASDRSGRKFWKPICDLFRERMVAFQVQMNYDEAAINAYVDEGRRVLEVQAKRDRYYTSGNPGALLAAYRNAHDRIRGLGVQQRLERNLSLFLHSMSKTAYQHEDLTDFTIPVPTEYGNSGRPKWLTSDTIIFDKAAARRDVAKNAGKLKKILAFRLDYEAYHQQEPYYARVLQLLEDELEKPEVARYRLRKLDFANHLPDVFELPAVKKIVDLYKLDKGKEELQEAWKSLWSEMEAELDNLHWRWVQALIDMVGFSPVIAMCHLTRLCAPQIPVKNTSSWSRYPSEAELPKIVFSCRKCGMTYLFYPMLLSHCCFNMVVNSSKYSDQLLHPVHDNMNRRLSHLNLKDVVYHEDTTIKLRVVLAAVWRAGEDAHLEPQGLSSLIGSFKCLDCADYPSQEANDRMSWMQATSHVLEIVERLEYQEDGEWLERPWLHQRLEYRAEVAPMNDANNNGWGAGAGGGWN